jgi:hypothetical protein
MKNDDEIIESLILGGLIGAALGALISDKKGEGATLGLMAGAALLATFKANEQAKQTNLPMYFAENGYLYQRQSDGTKKLIREIGKPSVTLQEHFTLK